MFNFQFSNPVQVTFGVGSLDKIGEVVSRFGKKTLILSGQKHARANRAVDEIKKILTDNGIESTSVQGIGPNPKLSQLVEISRSVKSDRPSSIVGLGGGSVMDAAKLVSLLVTHEGDPWEYRATGKLSVAGIQNILLPVITIPTTAGTGSEASPAALITHNNLKEVYFSPFLFPKATIIDPSLAVTLPADLTAQIGIDAFVQSLEAYVSSAAQPFSDMFAITSMKLVYENLPRLVKQLDNLALRSQLALAGLLSLYAIGQAGVGAVHALSDPLSGRHDIGHGLALSILLPQVMQANLDGNTQRFASLARVLCDVRETNDERNAKMSITLVENFLHDIGLGHKRLSDFGIAESEFPVFADEAENPDMATNPRKLSKEERIKIYRQIL